MWDLNTIVRMNDEAQSRADAIREYGARTRQAGEQDAVLSLRLAWPVNGEDEQAA